MTADEERDDEDETGGETPAGDGRHIGRVAALAAASGATAATAIAARKAYTARTWADSGDAGAQSERQRKSNDTAALVRDAVASGWAVAKDAVIPVIEDAATRIGGLVAARSPDLVRDVVVPKFIAGFEKASGKPAETKEKDTA